jgi:hypothetical protein
MHGDTMRPREGHVANYRQQQLLNQDSEGISEGSGRHTRPPATAMPSKGQATRSAKFGIHAKHRFNSVHEHYPAGLRRSSCPIITLRILNILAHPAFADIVAYAIHSDLMPHPMTAT